MIEEGAEAPEFCLEGIDSNGQEGEFCLKNLLATNQIILYFYPKDNTPGCTTEACDFRDNLNKIGQRAIVLGVSPDSLDSHRKFRNKHELNFYLLSDQQRSIMKQYGAFGQKKLYGKVTEGVIRSTFIINKEGIIIKRWYNVKTKGHVEQVLKALERA
ncbi:MAG: peroxiredoxin [Candidatus Magnetoovum sp. WYHC-5]|nr:peroxiredoxin [Candidatus Magnetoovum sp. WYHC-5]